MQPALSIGADPVQDGVAPALHHAEGAPPGRQRREGGARRSGWHSRERLADEADRFPELLDPNLKARLDISFFQDRNPEPQAGVGGERVIAANVAVDAGGAGDVAEDTVVAGGAFGQAPCAAQTVDQHAVAHADRQHFLEVDPHLLELALQRYDRGQLARQAAGGDRAAQQPVAGQGLVEPQQALADAQGVRLRQREPGVVGDGAQVGDVVVEPLHLEEHHARPGGARRGLGPRQRLDRLAVGQGMPHGRVARDPFRQLQALVRPAPLEQLLRPLVGEVETRLHVQDGLAVDAEAEVSRLDDPRVHRADRDFVDSLPFDADEGEGAPVVREIARRRRVLAERMVVLRPEAVADQGPQVGVPLGQQAEQVADLALVARGRVTDRRDRGKGGFLRRDRDGDLDEGVAAPIAEQVDDLKGAPVAATVLGQHQVEVEPGTRQQMHRRRTHRLARQGAAEDLPLRRDRLPTEPGKVLAEIRGRECSS